MRHSNLLFMPLTWLKGEGSTKMATLLLGLALGPGGSSTPLAGVLVTGLLPEVPPRRTGCC